MVCRTIRRLPLDMIGRYPRVSKRRSWGNDRRTSKVCEWVPESCFPTQATKGVAWMGHPGLSGVGFSLSHIPEAGCGAPRFEVSYHRWDPGHLPLSRPARVCAFPPKRQKASFGWGTQLRAGADSVFPPKRQKASLGWGTLGSWYPAG